MSGDAYPLSWPAGWRRAKYHLASQFGPHSVSQAAKEVLAELGRMGVRDSDVVISSNVMLRLDGLPRAGQAAPGDPGVAVYFTRNGKPFVLACDKRNRPEHNLWAIAKHIGALRGMERWGVGSLDQAFTGYAALPAPASDWKEVLGLKGEVTLELVQARYRALVKRAHPDAGGKPEEFHRLQAAWNSALEELA